MDAYPHPVNGSILEAKSFFERHSPIGSVVLEVYRKNTIKPVWLVTYRLHDRFTVKHTDFESDKYTVESIFEAESINGFNLIIEYGSRTPKTIGEKIKSCYDCCKKKRNVIPRRKHQDISLSQCTILVSRNGDNCEVTPNNVLPTDFPLKVMYNGQNKTKSFLKNSRLSRKTFTELLIRSRVPSSYIQFFTKPEETRHESPTTTDSDSSSTIKTEPPDYTSVSLDYKEFDNIYIKGKLHNPEVLSAAIDFLSICQFRSNPVRKQTLNGVKRRLFCSTILSYHGLPTDESLLPVFLDFCKDNRILNDEARRLLNVDDKNYLV